MVCGERATERFRVRRLVPPAGVSGSVLPPLRLKLAPGVTVGFLDRGGFGLRSTFGPGTKD